MRGKLRFVNLFHECKTEDLDVEGYITKAGLFTVDDTDILLLRQANEGLCQQPDCLCGNWVFGIVELENGRIIGLA